MSWRTVIVSNQAKLDCKMGYMVVRGEEIKRILLDEIAIVVIENPAVSITGCLIEAMIEKKIKVIFCDAKRSPAAELIPHHGSHDSAAKIRIQAAWPEEIKARIWQEIVTEKIRRQAAFLTDLKRERESRLLLSYIGQVELLDASNREGHAAKVPEKRWSFLQSSSLFPSTKKPCSDGQRLFWNRTCWKENCMARRWS